MASSFLYSGWRFSFVPIADESSRLKIPVIACVATLPLHLVEKLHEQVDVLDFMDKLDGGLPEHWVVLRAIAGGHVVYQGTFKLILAKAVLKSYALIPRIRSNHWGLAFTQSSRACRAASV